MRPYFNLCGPARAAVTVGRWLARTTFLSPTWTGPSDLLEAINGTNGRQGGDCGPYAVAEEAEEAGLA